MRFVKTLTTLFTKAYSVPDADKISIKRGHTSPVCMFNLQNCYIFKFNLILYVSTRSDPQNFITYIKK